jgi:hypothetical protein
MLYQLSYARMGENIEAGTGAGQDTRRPHHPQNDAGGHRSVAAREQGRERLRRYTITRYEYPPMYSSVVASTRKFSTASTSPS